jgi:transposase
MDSLLFDPGDFKGPSPGEVAELAKEEAAKGRKLKGKPRLRVPHRVQVEMHWASLDELLEPDHPARAVWQAVCLVDLSPWLDEVKAVEGHCGRDTTDPRLLLALWVLATLEGIGSARELERLCAKHLAYQWLCGGVSVNYHMLSDFRSEGGGKWDNVLTQIVAALMSEGLVTMQRVAQDGMKVRANAGSASFRRRPRLERFYEQARQQVKTLKRLAEENPEKLARRRLAAQKRAATDRERRLHQAVENCEQLQAQREATAKKSGRPPTEARASTTDPEARVMKFPDGGSRPGYNVQFSTDTPSRIIAGVDVINAGTDAEQLPPMLEQIEERCGTTPKEALVDGGFAALEAIEQATDRGCTVYAPLKDEEKQLSGGKNPYARKPGDSSAVVAWRARMGTAVAKTIYKWRAQTAEWVNALCRNRGLRQMPVRGLERCRNVARLYAITHNIIQGMALRARIALDTA